MTEAHAITRPPGGWTVDDLDSWPESHVRYELTDGALTLSPSPSGLHQTVSGLLMAHLYAITPGDLAATQAVDVRFARQLTRVPDLVVVDSDEPGRHWFAPAEVLLAIEIESSGSHTEDRITKPALYSRYGIPYFWRIELNPITVRAYDLDGEQYVEAAVATDRLTLDEPFPIDLPLKDLLPPYAR